MSASPCGISGGGLLLLASYPKSGNTWARAFLASAMGEGSAVDINANPAGTLAGADRAVFDAALGLDSAHMSPVAIARERHLAWTARLADPATSIWLKVHDAWAPFAAECPYPYAVTDVRAVIHVVRDPRDVAISFAHHFDLSLDEAIGWMEDESAMLDADPAVPARQLPQLLSSWSAHVSSWMAANTLGVLTVRYEDMHDAPIRTFGQIGEWAGLQIGPEQIARAVDQCSFTRLQSQETAQGFTESESRRSRFFREGRAGGWKDILSDDQAARIVSRHDDAMRKLGYLA